MEPNYTKLIMISSALISLQAIFLTIKMFKTHRHPINNFSIFFKKVIVIICPILFNDILTPGAQNIKNEGK